MFEKARTLDGKNVKGYLGLAYTNLISNNEDREWKRYLEEYMHSTNNYSLGIHYYQGLICSFKGDHEESLSQFNKALSEIGENYAEALFMKGVMLEKLEKVEEASQLISESLTLKPDLRELISNA